MPSTSDVTPDALQAWLSGWPSVKSQINLVITSLRRRQVVGSYACAKVTIEILRSVIGNCKFNSTYHMITIVRSIGRELLKAAPSELSIGNIVKRLLLLIREEYLNKTRIETSGAAASKPKPPLNRSKVQDRSRLSGRYNAADLDAELASLSGVGISDTESAVSRGLHSGSVTRGQDPYDMDADLAAMESIDGGNSTPVAPMSSVPAPCLALAGRGLSETLSHSAVLFEESDEATKFARLFPDMRQAIMGAVLEINEDLDNLHGPISDQAQEHIHEGECVLIYGYATLTESFLKAAARKRKFQVIIAEAEPSISGLKLAVSLAKASNNISVTLVPDSNIYALMSRVNKVIIAPHAVMIDGGCVCSAGHLMVAIAARDHSVPVVCLAGTYIMTPLLAHNQRGTLEQLLSPALVIPYHAPVNFDRTEVFVPAFDSVGPDLVALFVTNNGSHQPSYIYRLLGELYHPDDYAH